jgi:hypothetical protein
MAVQGKAHKDRKQIWPSRAVRKMEDLAESFS